MLKSNSAAYGDTNSSFLFRDMFGTLAKSALTTAIFGLLSLGKIDWVIFFVPTDDYDINDGATKWCFKVAQNSFSATILMGCFLYIIANRSESDSLRRRANARNISFPISLRCPIHIINPFWESHNIFQLKQTYFNRNFCHRQLHSTNGNWICNK